MKKIKILYVEDEPNLAKIVVDSLEAKNMEVEHVAHGSKAIKIFNECYPDICILDVMLPGKDGFAIGAEIRSLSPEIPILYLTAKNTTQDVLSGFKHGGNDYMRKPFSIEELIARIHNLQNINLKRESAKQEDWTIGLFTLFPLKQELHIRNECIRISHRENEILKILVARKAQNVARQEILTRLWGDDSYFNSRSLDVYISKIRNHFKRDSSVQLLTLKGVGYRLIDAKSGNTN